MTNYTTLTGTKATVGSIKFWINHAECPSADVLDEAEAFLFRSLRVPEMRTLLSDTIAITDSTIDVSALRYLDPISFQLTGDAATKVVHKPVDLFEELLTFDENGALAEGPPSIYTHDRSTIRLDTIADQAYTFRHWYYAYPARLGPTTKTSILTTKYPDLLRAACMMGAHDWMRNPGESNRYEQKAIGLIRQSNADADMALSGAQYEKYYG